MAVPTHYDYIFAGSGLASLLTVYRMVQSGAYDDKSILLIDPSQKNDNDRTWCFWEEGDGEWDGLLHRVWENARFANSNFNKKMALAPYRYKMLRGIDFYRFVKSKVASNPDISFLQDSITGFSEKGNIVEVNTGRTTLTCSKFFNSIYNPALPAKSKYPLLQQHFVGWFIKTEQAVFDKGCVTFMDFSIPQKGNTRFMYVLPLSETEALVEYTLFSEDLLPAAEYENAIKDYLTGLGVTAYEITGKERGSIPMTSYPFWENNSKNVLHIGSAGGWTKASTGYTFKNATKKSRDLADFLQKETDLRKFGGRNRFWFYDLLLLDILHRSNEKGSTIFSAMFKKAPPQLIFKFLDEETTIAQDIRVINACPKGIFIKAFLRNVF